MLTAKDLSNLLNRNGGALIDHVEESQLEDYIFLRNTLEDTDVVHDEAYRNTYRDLYHLNQKKITKKFKDRYFSVLEEYKETEEFDFLSAYRSIYGLEEKKKLKPEQFQYMTQMASVINDQYPIYERDFGDFFGFQRPSPTSASLTSRDRLNAYLGFYHHMRRVYEQILEEDMTHDLLKVFKLKFRATGKEIGPTKRLDFLARTASHLHAKGALV
jgi:hypothetical protein